VIVYAMEGRNRRRTERVMRAGGTKDAVIAIVAGRARRRMRDILTAAEAQFESRQTVIGQGIRCKRRAGETHEQALKGDNIAQDDADKPSPKTFRSGTEHSHAATCGRTAYRGPDRASSVALENSRVLPSRGTDGATLMTALAA
jgi:hypothetical protein